MQTEVGAESLGPDAGCWCGGDRTVRAGFNRC